MFYIKYWVLLCKDLKMKLNSLPILGFALSLTATAAVSQPLQQPTASSVLVCRAQQCAAAEYSLSKEFLFNKLNALFTTNQNKKVLVCEADETTRTCTDDAIEVAVRSSIVPSTARISSFEVVDSKLMPDLSLDLILDYDIAINDLKPMCQSARGFISVPFVDKIQMTVPDFSCQITATGNTAVNMTYSIDYVDFDYGILGAHYALGFGEVFQGGKNGYTLLRFTDKIDMSDTDMTKLLNPAPKPESVERKLVVDEPKQVLHPVTVQDDSGKTPVFYMEETASDGSKFLRPVTLESVTNTALLPNEPTRILRPVSFKDRRAPESKQSPIIVLDESTPYPTQDLSFANQASVIIVDENGYPVKNILPYTPKGEFMPYPTQDLPFANQASVIIVDENGYPVKNVLPYASKNAFSSESQTPIVIIEEDINSQKSLSKEKDLFPRVQDGMVITEERFIDGKKVSEKVIQNAIGSSSENKKIVANAKNAKPSDDILSAKKSLVVTEEHYINGKKVSEKITKNLAPQSNNGTKATLKNIMKAADSVNPEAASDTSSTEQNHSVVITEEHFVNGQKVTETVTKNLVPNSPSEPEDGSLVLIEQKETPQSSIETPQKEEIEEEVEEEVKKNETNPREERDCEIDNCQNTVTKWITRMIYFGD